MRCLIQIGSQIELQQNNQVRRGRTDRRKYKRIVQLKQSQSIEVERLLAVQYLQRKRLHFVVEYLVVQHEHRFVLEDLVHDQCGLVGLLARFRAHG